MAGLITVMTPEAVTAQLQEQGAAAEQRAPDLPALVSYLRSQWEVARRRKMPIEAEMLQAQRARAGEYSATEIAAIKAVGGTDAYRNLCDVKCRTAAAWLRDLILQPGESPFEVEPTAVPDLPEDVVSQIQQQAQDAVIAQAVEAEMQTGQQQDVEALKQQIATMAEQAKADIGGQLYDEARARADKMQRVITDQMGEAKLDRVFARFVDDLVTYQAGILKGPVIRMRDTLQWDTSSGYSIPSRVTEAAPFVDRVHPLDLYPVNPYDIEHSGVYERHQWHPGRLQQLIGVAGYREDEIRQVLADYTTGSLSGWLWTDNERDVSNKLLEHPGCIDALECWESVPGRMLVEWGLPVGDEDRSYQIHAFLIGTRLIRLVLNPHPLGKRPYHTASYVEGDTIWGRGVYSLIRDSVKAANSVYRAAINNCAMAWGPITEVNKDRLATGDDGSIYPLKRFFTTDDMATGTPAVRFTDIPYKGDAMLRALVEIEKRADDESGIPAYAHGNQDVGGAGKTSSGLSMLLGMATKTIKDVVRSIDEAIEGLVEGFYHHNMEFHPDPSIKGDCRVCAKGSTALVIKEQMAARLREFLAQTANQIDMQITGVEGRAYALKEAAKGLNLEADKLVPTVPQQSVFPAQVDSPGAAQSQALLPDGSPAGGEVINAGQ